MVRRYVQCTEIAANDRLTAQKRPVETGFGFGLLLSSSVEEELRAGRLHAIPVAAMRQRVTMFTIFPGAITTRAIVLPET